MTPWKQKKLTTILAKDGNCDVNKINCYGCPIFKCRLGNSHRLGASTRYAEAKRIMKGILFPEVKKSG